MPRLASLTSQALTGIGRGLIAQLTYILADIFPAQNIISTTITQWAPIRKSDIALQGNIIHVLLRRGNSSNLAEIRSFVRNIDNSLSFLTNSSTITLANTTSSSRVNASLIWDPVSSQLIILQIGASGGTTGMRYTYVNWDGISYTTGTTGTITSPTISGSIFGNSNSSAIHALWDSNRSRITVVAVAGARATIATFTNNGSSLSASNFINANTSFASSSLSNFEHPNLVQLANGSFLVLYGYNSVQGIIANVNVLGSMSWGTAVDLNTGVYDVAASADANEFIITDLFNSTSVGRRFTFLGTTITSQASANIRTGGSHTASIVYDTDTSQYVATTSADGIDAYHTWDGSTWTEQSTVNRGAVIINNPNLVSTDTGIFRFGNASGQISYSVVAKVTI